LETIHKSPKSKSNYFSVRPVCRQEEEYLRQVHKLYRELKIYRNPHAISEELRKACEVLAEPYLSEVLKEIKLTPHRASILARREEILMQSVAKKEVEGDAK